MSAPIGIGTAEIAGMLGVSREHVTDRITKQAGFPRPIIDVSQKIRRWSEADVRAWINAKSHRKAA